MNERGLDIPFIIVSGSIGEEAAVDAMRQGAADYLLKDRLARLGQAVRRAMREKQLREDHKRSEKDLHDSEVKFRSLVEQSSDGIVVIDEQSMIINWNSRQEEMTGIKQVEVLGRPLWDVQFQMMPDEIKNPAMEEMLKKAIKSLLRSGHSPRQGQELETLVQLNDGTRRTLIMTTYQFKTEKGFMAGSISRDITEQKKAEEVIRNLARFPSENPNPVLRIALDGNLLYANKAAFHLLKIWELDLGKPVPEILKNPAVEVFESRTTKTVEVPCGEQIYSFSMASSLKDEDISLYARNITERKRAEEKLYESEKEFHSLAESMPQIVWITRPDGWNIYFNQQWVDYTGLTLEESYGHGWNKPFHPDDQQRAWDAWQNATGNLGQYSIECRLRRADGIYKWWLISRRTRNG